MLEAFGRDVKYGLRAFGRNPGFTAVAVLTMALGLGANTAIFAVLYNVVLRPLPYPDAGRLTNVYLTHNSDHRGPRDIGFAYPKYQDLKRVNTVFDATAVFASRRYTVTAPGPAEQMRGEVASATYFQLLGFPAAVGRAFVAEDDGVAILSDTLWRSRFGADTAVIGKSLWVDGKRMTIVGVMPEGVRGDSGTAQFWLPLASVEADDLISRRQHWHQVIAHLKPGVTVPQAAAEVRAIMRRLEEQQPTGSGIWDANVESLAESKIDVRLSKGLVILYAAVGFVLLIACANLANLTMARMVGRQREIAVRAAIGAGRWSLIRQVLVENVLLSAAGGVAGTLVAVWSMRAMAVLHPETDGGFWPTYMRQLDAQTMRVTGPVLVFSAVLALAAGILFGLAPALRAARGDVNDVLKGGSPQGGGVRRGMFAPRSVLLVGQMALVVVLLVGAGLLIRSFARLTENRLAVQMHNLLTVPLNLPWQRYPDAASRAFYDRVREQVRALPGVEAVAVSQNLPSLERGVSTVEVVDGRPTNEYIGWMSADPGFFEIFRIPILEGRTFEERDRQGFPVAVLSETAARALFPGRSAVGHRIKANRRECEIVGVAADVHFEKQKPQLPIVGDMYYAPARGAYLTVRTAANPMGLLPAVRKIVAGIDPQIPVQGARTMDERVALLHSYERFSVTLLGIFAAVALGLAVVGIYGVFSYAVAARTREFGIRLATGARGIDLVRMVLREAAVLCAAALAIGIPAAIAASRVLGSLISGAAGGDLGTYVGTGAILVMTALAASLAPALRAARVDPLRALRCE